MSKAVQKRLRELEADVLPEGVNIYIARDYGKTANDKVNNLVGSLGIAIAVVIGLILLTMGWREALIVGMTVPITFSLAMLVNYLAGYTINRVTLFALILSLGLVVDDPITNVDNIQRHILGRKKKPLQATLTAVQEVLPPVILSTLAIIASFTPMFFITGMMGPYMRPMAINVPLAVTFSTLCALTIVPWLSYYFLRKKGVDTKPATATTEKDDISHSLFPRFLSLSGIHVFTIWTSPLVPVGIDHDYVYRCGLSGGSGLCPTENASVRQQK